MNVRLYPVIRSIADFIIPDSIMKRPGSGGSFNSMYCYSVWLRHLKHLFNSGLISNVSEVHSIAEIGPGDSLGIGMSALYTGSKNYFAFDVIEHTTTEKNLQINKELLELFINQTTIPHGKDFEGISPILNNYSFPNHLLNFDPVWYRKKYEAIDSALLKEDSELKISYIVPWNKNNQSKHSEIDLIFSQAVMEHVDDINFAYSEMYKWLRKGGIISHQIDFKAHEMTKEWNGHWYIPERLWEFMLRGRKYPINRLPLTAHIKAIEKSGFKIINIVSVKRENKFIDKNIKVSGIEYTKEDLITSGALIQAVKL